MIRKESLGGGIFLSGCVTHLHARILFPPVCFSVIHFWIGGRGASSTATRRRGKEDRRGESSGGGGVGGQGGRETVSAGEERRTFLAFSASFLRFSPLWSLPLVTMRLLFLVQHEGAVVRESKFLPFPPHDLSLLSTLVIIRF